MKSTLRQPEAARLRDLGARVTRIDSGQWSRECSERSVSQQWDDTRVWDPLASRPARGLHFAVFN